MCPWALRRSAARSRESSLRLASGSARASGTAGEHGSRAPWGAPISPPRRPRASPPPPEPARWAGGDVAVALPRGAAAAPLRRFLSEVEMWLHAQELNDTRRRRGAPPVTTLWPWGATGGPEPPERRATHGTPLAFG